MNTPIRTIALALGIVTLALMLAAGLCFLVCPTWLTGGYFELVVYDVTIRPDGIAVVHADETTAYGTLVENLSIPGPDGYGSSGTLGWNREDSPFLRWPNRKRGVTILFDLRASKLDGGNIPGQDVLRERFLLKPGRYRAYCGELLPYARVVYPNGRVADGRYRIKQDTAVNQ